MWLRSGFARMARHNTNNDHKNSSAEYGRAVGAEVRTGAIVEAVDVRLRVTDPKAGQALHVDLPQPGVRSSGPTRRAAGRLPLSSAAAAPARGHRVEHRPLLHCHRRVVAHTDEARQECRRLHTLRRHELALLAQPSHVAAQGERNVANDLPIPWSVVLPARPTFVGHGLTPFLLHIGHCCSSFPDAGFPYMTSPHSSPRGGGKDPRAGRPRRTSRSRLRRTDRDPLDLSTCCWLEAL
jgi:hypothetical protein